LARELDQPDPVFNTLFLLDDATWLRVANDLAHARYEERGDPPAPGYRPWQLRNLGFLAVLQGELGEAESFFRESMSGYGNQGNTLSKIECLVGFAALVVARGEAERGARLLGAVDGALATIGAKLYPGDSFERARTLHAQLATLSETTFATAWVEGQATALEKAIAYAVEEDDT
jgi:hypothetical protein